MMLTGNKEITKSFGYVLDLVYPRRCPVCDGVIAPFSFVKGELKRGPLIHGECEKKLRHIKGATCLKCGKRLSKAERDEEYCVDCRKHRHLFDRGFSLFEYRSVSGSIYRFKYAGRREYAEYYAKVAAGRYGKRLKSLGIEAIIPVPMYEKKQNTRGYNQAEVFGKRLSEELGIPMYSNVIRRVRNTLPMKNLDVRGRRNNLKKAFNIVRNDVKFRCILIIDDIYTTGSTVNEIAQEFHLTGTDRVYVLTLAIGQTT